jgi:transcriptional regulator with XRE-family HTH domain
MTPIEGPDAGLNAAVAAELRAERAAQNLTVQELAERSAVPYASLRRYLAAERHIDVATLETLAKALGTSTPDLVWAATERLNRGAGGIVIEADFGNSSEPARTVDESELTDERNVAQPPPKRDVEGESEGDQP